VLNLLRSHLSYANIVATIALFLALVGTGYAALTITGKNVRNNSLTGKDVRNSSLTTRDVKNRSLLSRDFKAGQLPAEPGEALPSGATLRGTYAASGTAATAGVVVRDAPSFALRVPADWTSHVILSGATAPATCPGTVNAPEAQAGHLCVYEGFGNNRALVVDAAADTGSTSFGWIAQIASVAAGSFQSRGTWAITAP
jgi:hypothetical protein